MGYRRSRFGYRSLVAVVWAVALVAAGPVAGAVPAASRPRPRPAPLVRVDQVGYRTFEAKTAVSMTAPVAAPGARFSVRAVRTGRDSADRPRTPERPVPGAPAYGAVHPIDFTALTPAGARTRS